MRIFLLISHSSIGGPIFGIADALAKSLTAEGCTVVTHPWGARRSSEGAPAKVAQRVRDIGTIRRAMGADAFDVAIVNTSHDWRTLARDIPLLLATRGRCRRFVLYIHGAKSRELLGPGRHAFKLATSLLLRLVDASFVLSSEERDELQRFRKKPPVFLVKNPFPASGGRRPAAQDERSTRPPRVLFVGRLLPAKGVLQLVEALPGVLAEAPCELEIVGDGDLAEEIRSRVEARGLGSRVRLSGYLRGDDLSRAYEEADVFVLPTSHPEGFPTVLAEAMDAGLAIVTTPIRGAVDVLRNGEHALLVPPHDLNALVAAIVTLVTDADFRRRMGAANRERVAIFRPDVVAREQLAILRQVVGSPSRTACRSRV